MLTAVANFR